MSKIRTAVDAYPTDLVGVPLAERAVAWLDAKAGRFDRPRATGETRRKAETLAYVNQGRWVADCPSGCGSALVVDPEDPRFFCPECRNAAIEHDFAVVVFPGEKLRDAIAAVLLERPNELHRSWLPTESLEDLRVENENPFVATGADTLPQERERAMIEGVTVETQEIDAP